MSSGKKGIGVSNKVWGYSATVLAANTGIYLIGYGHPIYGGLAVMSSFGANYYTEFGMPAINRAPKLIPVQSSKVESSEEKSPKAEEFMAGARS